MFVLSNELQREIRHRKCLRNSFLREFDILDRHTQRKLLLNFDINGRADDAVPHWSAEVLLFHCCERPSKILQKVEPETGR